MSSVDSDETFINDDELADEIELEPKGPSLVYESDDQEVNKIDKSLPPQDQHIDQEGENGLESTPKQTHMVWCVGDNCMAPFCEDGKYYEGKIEKICRESHPYSAQVRYVGYESDECEKVLLSALCLSPQTKRIMESKARGESAQQARILKEYSDRKDRYMKQKYDSSEDESAVKISKKKKLCFDGVTSHKDPTTDLKPPARYANCIVNMGEEDPHELQQKAISALDSYELEKPKFEIEPVGEKVPFNLTSKEATKFVQIPATINQYLRDYQREGVEYMYRSLSKGEGCVLGDDMGLGKTVQVIALISAVFGKKGTKEDVVPSFAKSKEPTGETDGPFLIVSPSSVLYNWEDELNTWGYFKASRFHRTTKEETMEKAKRGKLDIVLTTYETFRIHVDEINLIDWTCTIMDEAHRIKDPSSLISKAAKKLKCRCRIGLTGTPMQNKMEELWCLLDWVNPGCLGSSDQFTEHFASPIKHGQRFEATKRELATARKKQQEFGLLKDKWILRRTKDILENQLPRKDERAVFAPLSPLQFELYKAVLSLPAIQAIITHRSPSSDEAGKEKPDEHRSEVFQVIALLRKVANHAALLLPHHKASAKQQEMAFSVCKKLFSQFPMLEDIYRNGSFAKMSDRQFSGKLRIVDKLLDSLQLNKDKVLLFSTSVQLLNILEAYVLGKGYMYRRLDGGTKPDHRMLIIREFNNQSDVFICLVSTKAGGVGLNFTGANVVIIFDPSWNPSYDCQAEDRAHRIGQHRNVRVYRLISEGCIEENIYLRQIYKQQLSNIAIETSNERRLFKGVAGCRSKHGELFGLQNLFVLRKATTNLTSDLLKRTEKVESGIRTVEYKPKQPSGGEQIGKKVTSNLDADDYNDSQYIEEIESDLEASVNDSLSSEKEASSDCEDDNEGSEAGSESSMEDDINPPLLWKNSPSEVNIGSSSNASGISRKVVQRRSEKSDRRKNKVLSPQSKAELSSEETGSFPDLRGYHEEVVCNVLTSNQNLKALEPIDQVLDECGVRYTCTKKTVLSRSVAEDKMSREAVRDVFWHGMYSQEPAHFIDHSTSDESDDVPCTSKEKRPDAEGSAVGNRTEADECSQSNSTSSKKRIFERIGNDMFLIGETPPLIRRQQFERISKYYGFESTLEFAKELVKCSENELKCKLLEFYKSEEPAITQISSLKNIYIVEEENTRHASAKPKTPKKSLRRRPLVKRDKGIRFLESCHGREDRFLGRRRKQGEIEYKPVPALDKIRNESSDDIISDEDVVVKSAGRHVSIDFVNEFDKAASCPLNDKMDAFSSHDSAFSNTKGSTIAETEEFKLPVESTNSQGSYGILDELMFSPIKDQAQTLLPENKSQGSSSDTMPQGCCEGHSTAKSTIVTNLGESTNEDSPSSFLEELMRGTLGTSLCEGALCEQGINKDIVSDVKKVESTNESQDSLSVLDELMG